MCPEGSAGFEKATSRERRLRASGPEGPDLGEREGGRKRL